MEFVVTLAEPEDLAALADIEARAATLFDDHPLSAVLAGVVDHPRDFAAVQAADLLWVARIGNTPIGFVLVEATEDGWHLEEIDVHPDHGRKGIGAALVRAVCAAATQRASGHVTLTTFRDVPWNEPFYSRLGFQAIAPQDLSPAFRARVAQEAARGLPANLRVAMSWTTYSSGQSSK